MRKTGHVIATLRKKHGLTQEQLGAKLNVSYQAVSKWEHDLSEPDLETTKKLCKIFNISVSDFFDMIDNPNLIGNLNQSVTPTVKKKKIDPINFIKTKPWYLVASLGVLILMLSLCAFLIPVKYSDKQILNQYNPSIFYLSAEGPSVKKSGTGFFINNNGLAVTTYKKIQDCTSGKVKLHNGNEYDIEKVVGIDKENDLAIIQIDLPYSTPVQLANSNTVKLGDFVYSITHASNSDLDAESIITQGTVFKVESNTNGTTSIQTTASLANATSGGVLLNGAGKVIGIVSDYLRVSGVGMDMVNVCTPSNYINSVKRDINLSLYDYCKSINGTYTVNFDDNNADSGEMNSREFLRFFSYDLTCEFTKEGYNFDGWNYNGTNYGTRIYNLGEADQTITLTAEWKEIEIEIEYNLNGGVNNEDNVKTLKYWDDNFTLLPARKIGYEFDGWYLDAEFTKPIEIINPKLDTNYTYKYTVYAKFNLLTYSITYVLNDGTNDPLNPTTYTVLDRDGGLKYFELKDAQKVGYTFNGWYDNPEFTGDKVKSFRYDSCENKTLYAKFTIIEYRIDYEPNGGSVTVEYWYGYYTVKQGKFVSDVRPKKDGYVFKGWYDNPELTGEEVITVSYSSGYIGTVYLYAKWEPINP